MRELILSVLTYFNYMAEQVTVDQRLFTFNADRTKCAIVDYEDDHWVIHIYVLRVDQWIEDFKYRQANSQVNESCYRITSISMDGAGDNIAIGFIDQEGTHKGICLLLSVYNNTVIENTAILPSQVLSLFGYNVRFSQSGKILLISSPDFTEERDTAGTGAVFIYKCKEDEPEGILPVYNLVSMIRPDDKINIERFGLAMVVAPNDYEIAILGEHEAIEIDQTVTEIVLTVVSSLDTGLGISDYFTGQKQGMYEKYFISWTHNNRVVVTGLKTVSFKRTDVENVESTFNERHEFNVEWDNTNHTHNVEQINPDARKVVTLGQHALESNLNRDIPLIPVPVSADTDQLKIDKDKTMLRHHLILQNLLNNISLAVKNNEPVDVRIKGLEITPERVKITLLEFVNHSDKEANQ